MLPLAFFALSVILHIFFIFAPIFYVEICLLPLKVQILIYLFLSIYISGACVCTSIYSLDVFCPCNLRILNNHV